ncbi:nitrate- and nitrite sensing domain-containing protein [Nocardia sp. NPDC004860]|uniref:sensor histidine kinase n=1 Tax=Nocardia sp. NPDC004860 TaxID=3154557 RepID=UPI0033AB8473
MPSTALLLVGALATGYLVKGANEAQNWASAFDRDSAPLIDFALQMQQERRLTLMKMAGDDQVSGELTTQRTRADQSAATVQAVADRFVALDPGGLGREVTAGKTMLTEVALLRQRVDSRVASADDVYSFFARMLDILVDATDRLAFNAPASKTAADEAVAARLLRVAEAQSRANALAVSALIGGGLSEDQRREFGRQVGFWRAEIDSLRPRVTTSESAQLDALAGSAAWQRLRTMEDALIEPVTAAPENASAGSRKTVADSTRSAQLPMGIAEWQDAAVTVSSALLDIWRAHYRYAITWSVDDGARVRRDSLLGGAIVLVISLGALLTGLQLSRRLFRRLARLHSETLDLADEQLPRITARLREGHSVDLETDVARLDFGRDEIGQVADAFNRAQTAAVSAAVGEAATRAGVNALFLNIAYRIQMVLRKQLELLDQAEREQEDPKQLEMLFRVDHLATRLRRNAENLTILGGGRPGRQWRRPVLLFDLLRSAVGESTHYTRVRVAKQPQLFITGAAVADLIHMFAELLDNATSFSPPDTEVEIVGMEVGKGIAVEIADQGLGMTAADMRLANETLRNPPDFSVAQLSSDSRLGLFVVAQLARRQQVKVRLSESVYGGVRAVVVLPTALIGEPIPADGHDMSPPESDSGGPATASPRGERPSLPRRERSASLSPHLVDDPADEPDSGVGARYPAPGRSADQARDLMSAIETGSRQGRQRSAASDVDQYDPYDGEERP